MAVEPAPGKALCGCDYKPAPATRYAGITVNPHQILRVVEFFPPVEGNQPCPCCLDTFTHRVSARVEHTTWGYATWDSICSSCVENPHWRMDAIRADAAARAAQREQRRNA